MVKLGLNDSRKTWRKRENHSNFLLSIKKCWTRTSLNILEINRIEIYPAFVTKKKSANIYLQNTVVLNKLLTKDKNFYLKMQSNTVKDYICDQ